MFEKIKKIIAAHKKDFEEFREKDIALKKAEVRAYVMRFYQKKYEDENNPIPYWIAANKEIESRLTSDKEILFYHHQLRKRKLI